LSEIIGLSSTLDVSALDISVLAVSPLQQLHSSFLEKTGVQLYVKRDDLIHPLFGGTNACLVMKKFKE